MSELLRYLVLGLGFGALYALAAHGVVLIYRGSGVINFAQGAMGMIGAFIYYQLRYGEVVAGGGVAEARMAFVPAFLAAIVSSASIGLLTYVLIMRPLRHASPLARLVATLGVLTVLSSLASTGPRILGLFDWGVRPIGLPSFYSLHVYDLGGDVTISGASVTVLLTACGLTVVLWAVYRWTSFGRATVAVSENQRAASALGWSPDLIAGANWAIGAALAGVAGVLVIPFFGGLAVPQLTSLVLAALAAALVAEFRSFPIVLGGGLAIGALQSMATNYLGKVAWLQGVSTGIGQAVPFFVIVLYLALRGTSLPVRGFLFDRLPSLGTGTVRPRAVVAGTAVVTGVLLVASTKWVDALAVTLIFGLLLLSVVTVTGLCGQVSLAQWTLAGVGAFTAARLFAAADLPFELATLAAIVVTVAVGVLFALPAVRTRGVNLAIVTLGLGVAAQEIVFNNARWNGGLGGTVLGSRSFLGLDIDRVDHPRNFALLALGAFVLSSLAVLNVRRGRIGRRLIAVRTNERAAASLGVNVVTAKLYAFALASAIAALGGILFAFRNRSVDFTTWSFNADSIALVGLAVIGGVGFVIGPGFGATLASGALGAAIASEFLEGVEEWMPLIGGVVLIGVLLTNPDGLAQEHARIVRRLLAPLRGRRRDAAPARPFASTGPSVARRVTPRRLTVKGLSVGYGGSVVLDGLDVELVPGKIVGLIGPNGAGKTTAIDAITGFVPKASGEVLLDGASIAHLPVYRRARAGVARSFQSFELFDDLTVLENLRTAADPKDWAAGLIGLVRPSDPPLHGAAVAAIQEFGLQDELHAKISDLPLGRRRIVGVARAVAAEPSVLLLDEPAAGLGGAESGELASLVRRLADDWGLAVLLVEHDLDFVMSVCDRLVVLDFGRVIADGTPEQIRADPAVIEAYLGAPAGTAATV